MARKQRTAPISAAKASASSTAVTAAIRGQGNKIGHELRTATATSDKQALDLQRHNIRFDLTTEIAYQAIREQYFARFNRFLTGLQVLLGTSAVAAMVSWFPDWAIWLVAVSALAGVWLLVIDPAGAARDHRALRSRLHMIRASMEESACTEQFLGATRAAMIRVAADSPPAYRGAQALAYNNAVNATYEESIAGKHRYTIGFWRGLVSNMLPMRGHQFKKGGG